MREKWKELSPHKPHILPGCRARHFDQTHADVILLVCWPAKSTAISRPVISSSLAARPPFTLGPYLQGRQAKQHSRRSGHVSLAPVHIGAIPAARRSIPVQDMQSKPEVQKGGDNPLTHAKLEPAPYITWVTRSLKILKKGPNASLRSAQNLFRFITLTWHQSIVGAHPPPGCLRPCEP